MKTTTKLLTGLLPALLLASASADELTIEGDLNVEGDVHIEPGDLFLFNNGTTLSISGTTLYFGNYENEGWTFSTSGDVVSEDSTGFHFFKWDAEKPSLVAGESSINASGDYSMAVGAEFTSATKNWSVAIGYDASAGGTASAAIGYEVWAGGYNSRAFGEWTFALSNYSTAIGHSTYAEAQHSVAIGAGNIGGGNGSTWIETDPLFEIGNGGLYDTYYSNAMTVLKNGRTTITNKFWDDQDPTATPSSSDASEGEALIVEGHSRFRGVIRTEQPAGDLSMGAFTAQP